MPQTVKTPRIYINVPEYLATTGTAIDPLFRTLPFSAISVAGEVAIPTMSGLTYTNPYIAFLGHNFGSVDELGISYQNGTIYDIINGKAPYVTGFSILEVAHENSFFKFIPDFTVNISSVVTGTYYDFPHSADLNLTLEYSYEGIKEITTKGGSTLTNQFFNKAPYDWELGDNIGNKYRKSGRRIWNLSFSFLSSDSVFPTNSALDNNDATTTTDATTTDTLLDSDSLQRVVHLLNGFQNSFIFSPDNTSTQQDNFAICKIEANSFKLSQQAPNLYTTSMKIKEVW